MKFNTAIILATLSVLVKLSNGFLFGQSGGAGDGAGGLQSLVSERLPKPYSGLRVSNDSRLEVLWFKYTVAILELGPGNKMINCEIVDTIDIKSTKALLQKMSRSSKPRKIPFVKMMNIIGQCRKQDQICTATSCNAKNRDVGYDSKSIDSQTLLKAIIPGTKWCGPGNIAVNYHELGPLNIDRCCRAHDFCPLHLSGFALENGFFNLQPYTASHCMCDDALYQCLAQDKTSSARTLGHIYFNILKALCIEKNTEGYRFRNSRRFPY